MALCIVSTEERHLVGSATLDILRQGLEHTGRVVLLCPSFNQALQAQKSLSKQGICLGVDCTTASAWIEERWEVWGDGRHLIDSMKRRFFARRVLQHHSEGEPLAGTVNLLADFAAANIAWLQPDKTTSQLTQAEKDFVGLVEEYRELIHRAKLIEETEAMAALPTLLAQHEVAMPVFVVTGMMSMTRALRKLLCDLAELSSVNCIMYESKSPACDVSRQLIAQLQQEAQASNTPLRLITVDTPESIHPLGKERPVELDVLLRSLFVAEAERLQPTGAVELLLCAGPLAESEALARHIKKLAQAGCKDIVVCTSDVSRASRELSQKLLARGFTLRTEQKIAFADMPAGQAFLAYFVSILHLNALAQNWPAPEKTAEGAQVTLGNMDWWPPRGLSDFLMSGLSQVPAESARRLDRSWRNNRLLTPAQVLVDLQSEKKSSRATALATRELLRGRTKVAAAHLLEGIEVTRKATTGPKRAFKKSISEQKAVVAALMSAAMCLEELGVVTAQAKPAAISLDEYGSLLQQLLLSNQVILRWNEEAITEQTADVQDQSSPCLVHILSPTAAACLPASSTDALVLCGLTSVETSIPRDPSLASSLAERLHIEEAPDPIAYARAQFAALLALPRKQLLLERCLKTADGKDAYSAVMLVELLSCYGVEGSDKPEKFLESTKKVFGNKLVGERFETEIQQNLAWSGENPHQRAIDTPAPAGKISPALTPFVIVPNEGRMLSPHELPLLSASQIETYLECPYKWFSLRRLRLSDADAGFGPAEMGTFAHRVLELTHGRLSEEGVSVHTTGGLQRAHELLDEVCAEHYRHQYLLRGGNTVEQQALIPHVPRERAQLDRLSEDLHSLLDYESTLFLGYEPKQFEWSFGRGEEPIEYAGARLVGTIDRVDVDAHGLAVVIDYKHKGVNGFTKEYDAFANKPHDLGDTLKELRRVQSLIYAQVVRRAHPELHVVGAVYLCTRDDHALAGAVDANQAERIYGQDLSKARAAAVCVDPTDDFGRREQAKAAGSNWDGDTGLDGLLDACEEAIAPRIAELRAGVIEANPLDEISCQWCPVLNCEKRRS